MEIIKIGGVIFNSDKSKIVVVRKFGTDTFIIPGGKPDGDETELETLGRELEEELAVQMSSATHLGNYTDIAQFEGVKIRMSVYLVEVVGTLKVSNEIEALMWIDYKSARQEVALGSTLVHHILPELSRRELLNPS